MSGRKGRPIQANYGPPMKTHTTGVPHKTDKERLKEIEEMKKFWSEKDKRAEAIKTRDDKIKKQKEQEEKSKRFFNVLKKPF